MRRELSIVSCMLATACRLEFDPMDTNPCAAAAESADQVYRWDDHCYSFHSFLNGFYDARAACESIGAHLVTYTTAEESDAVAAGLGLGGSAWIGMDYNGGFGEWNWVTGEPEPYGRWAPGEPVLVGGAVAQLPDGSWFSTATTTALGSICETAVVITHAHVYIADYGLANWDVARATCEQRGGHLATITSAEEQLLIDPFLGSEPLWIGSEDVGVEGVNVWVTGEPFRFADWATFEPDTTNGTEDCVAASISGWTDRLCSTRLATLCELE